MRICLVTLLSATLTAASVQAQQAGSWTSPLLLNHRDTQVYYPCVTASREGRVYAAWDNGTRGFYAGGSRICLAMYDGQSWTGPVAVSDSGNKDYDPALATDSLGHLHLLWNRSNTGELLYQTYNGQTWSSPPVDVSQTPGASQFPAPVIDRQNHLQVVWQDHSPGNTHVFYRSFDGVQWSNVEDLSDSTVIDFVPHLTVDLNNDLHLAFNRVYPPRTDEDIIYRKRQDGHWSPPADLDDDSTQTSHDCDIAVDRKGQPWVLWSQGLAPTATPALWLIMGSTLQGGSWTLPVPIDSTTEAVSPRLAYDPRRDIVHAVWILLYRPAQVHRLLYSYRMNGQWHTPEVILGPLPLGSPPAICLDSAGCCHVAFASNDSGVYYVRQQVPVGVSEQERFQPEAFELSQNYPNPFNGQTVISYTIIMPGPVRLRVCDLLGREVRVLVDSDEHPPGIFRARLDATGLASGAYFYELQSQNQRRVRRMLLIR